MESFGIVRLFFMHFEQKAITMFGFCSNATLRFVAIYAILAPH